MKTTLKNLTCSLLLIGSSLTLFAQDPAGNSVQMNYLDYQNDGILRYINCGNDNSLNPGDNLTIESWIKVYDSGWNQKVFGKLNGSFNSGFMLAIDQGKLYPEVWTPGQSQLLTGFIPPVPNPGYWVHLAVTFEKGVALTGYINGVNVGQTTVPNSPITANTENFIIGIAPWDLSNFQFFGEIDEVRVWNVAKSEIDINAAMFTSLTGSETGLMAYYDFNQSSGTSLPDLSPNSNDGTFVGLTANDWVASRAVVGNATAKAQTDIKGFWNALAFSDPRSVATTNGISIVASNIPTYDYLVMGHNNGTGITVTDIPTNATANFNRLDRVWYFNVVGAIDANLYFNLTDAAGGGTMLDNSKPAANYMLLERDSATGLFTAIAAADNFAANVVTFNNVALSEDKYYTVGVGDTPIPLGIIKRNSTDLGLNIYPNPTDGFFTFTIDNQLANATVKVVNTLGEVVYYKEMTNIKSNKINLENTPAGIYFLTITNDNETAVKRFTIK
jgi:hypothetical protein